MYIVSPVFWWQLKSEHREGRHSTMHQAVFDFHHIEVCDPIVVYMENILLAL